MKIECRLPFDAVNLGIRISQGNNGPWSHFVQERELPGRPGIKARTDLAYAVDFALPYGTFVRAARGGMVFAVYGGSDYFYDGTDPTVGNNIPMGSTNLVIIEHDDGTRGTYSHLSQDLIVQRGQRVEVGQIIGKTGKSGWIGGIPHLHFQVSRVQKAWTSVPVEFQDCTGSLDHTKLVSMGKIYSILG
jgi:murein DD-endopeptidase MepM/ murein hydrolase activator NlpD